ncbi:MAG: 50S ribosomal protein L3 [Candidatus Nealsonbacteria bacterium CG10_big_fil_rev_8_21_14_0_10_36_24]|uniref:Large ribosomal subunit protein uL3 n=2 Tax=Candidatus Nealsoniibacteriota TaxID=1817911 RepID=A0A2H0YMZ3_9BACT|nr:MAG: 50S ribosomal protein L3 [Candidatus Nealsonbacteria bacterium CG10_big_fil_rev_8_21_14_0_10_36_24]PIS39871.1 MAG: 50S ribosomal protein L3 [Candidatus Nealsonbacteria bacterium CG08_land_8_20_14_0_20_36_22]
MMKFILGKKIEMSQMFDEEGNVIPVTLIEAGPCYITQIKTKEKDKYEAIQIGLENLKEKKIKKPQKDRPYRHLKEFKMQKSKFKIGDKIDVSIFKEGDKVKISGISKGKGFAGAVKRWHFRGRSPSHGTKHEERTIGSTGRRFPQRVIKGRKMPGRMGTERVTIKNLKIVQVDSENNLLALKGAVPGRRGTLVEIRG